MSRSTVWALACLILTSAGAGAQDIEELDLPRSVAADVVAFFNDPATIRFQGRAEVPEGRFIVGDVAVLRGPLRVAGEIDGDVIVVNGDLQVTATGRITGDVIVLGGAAEAEPGSIAGQLAVFDESLPYAASGDRIELVERRRRGRDRFEYVGSMARSRLSFRVEDSYNRVEGLPVRFGPVVETRGENWLRFDALGVWRTDRGLTLDTDDIGWFLRAEQHFGRDGGLTIGGTAHSLVTPIERWGLSDIEASLSAFFFHEDYRDYYEREGYSGYLRYDHEPSGVRLGLEYRDEDHLFVPVGSPWTLKRNDASWRPQPLVAEGRLRTVTGEIVVDDRNDPENPTDGWYLAARGTFGVGGSISLPGYREAEPGPLTEVAGPRLLGNDVRSGFLDLRRYLRVGPATDLRLRGVIGGSLDGRPLPPQFQHALGGEGSLPGHPTLSADCGARTRPFSVVRERDGFAERVPVFAGYGCDRIVLGQIEYRSSFDVGFDLGSDDDEWVDDWGWYPAVDFSPSWSLFLNAGRGWSLTDVGEPGFLGGDTDTLLDVGAGIHLGSLGLYWAVPLDTDDTRVNFFIRIDHRF